MATPAQLAEQHRRAQATLMAALTLRLRRAWAAAITEQRASELAEDWVRRMLPVILAYRARSAALAQVAYGQQRRLVLPGEPDFTLPGADPLEEEVLEAALAATGIAEYLADRYERGQTHEHALERSATTVAGAGAKHALDGGRSVMDRAVARDRLALGWYRVTKAGACSFCAVLASRGAVYKEDSFADSDPRWIGDGSEKVHDHCACTLAPIWRRDQELPDRNTDFTALWEATTKLRATAEDVARGRAERVGQKFTGRQALNAFRREYEKIHPPATD